MENNKAEPDLHPIVALSRYFTWAACMKRDFYRVLPKFNATTRWNEPAAQDMFMYMCYWYATLYVVVEGWQELGLNDSVIDTLIQSPMVELLRRYRNGVYHFQRTYYDTRHLDFMNEMESVEWVRGLHEAFFKWFNGWFGSHCLDGSPRE